MKCSYHPDVETALKCGKCGQPICPKCLVPTPVGARCPECARLAKLPTFDLSARHYLVASATALGLAIGIGFIWGMLRSFLPFLVLDLLLAAGVGFVISEVVGRAANRKRGKWLALIGAVAIPLSYLASIPGNMLFKFDAVFHFLDILAIAIGIFVAVIRLR
jgi:hypothetical protein